jgi:hypothetical protein
MVEAPPKTEEQCIAELPDLDDDEIADHLEAMAPNSPFGYTQALCFEAAKRIRNLDGRLDDIYYNNMERDRD